MFGGAMESGGYQAMERQRGVRMQPSMQSSAQPRDGAANVLPATPAPAPITPTASITPAPTTPAAAPAAASPQTQAAPVALSVVVPVYNEVESVPLLYERLVAALEELGQAYEIIFVDDGSRDGSFATLKDLHECDSHVRVVRFRRNFGKTPALVAGFLRARGEILFTLDADLQDDPAEIPRFLDTLAQGYDLVCGWKYPRHDPITKTVPSRVFNGMVSATTGVKLHDINCGFKAYRRELIEDLTLYGELHRFIPVLAHQRGFRVAEVQVRHHPRRFGTSKFGAKRFLRGFLDLMMVLFLMTYLRTPLRLFGTLGLLATLIGIGVDLYVVLDRVLPFGSHQPIHDRPLLFVGILFLIFGVSFILAGLQSEMIRHFAYRPEQEYSVRQVLE
jgi:glycosyltransferase involved in cell wall biosynthesis